MSYQVSESIRSKFEQLIALPEVQAGLTYLEDDQNNSIQEQIEITLTEAPTFHEQNRALLMKNKFEDLGISQVWIDDIFNVEGIIPGKGSGLVLLESHIDSVFAFGTVKEVRREDDKDMLYAPGIYDNARGMSCMLGALRAIRHAGIETSKSLVVAGTVREEVPGGMEGMKTILDRYSDLEACISVDGGYLDYITFNATYNRDVEYTFSGKGGHPSGAFGLIANSIGAASRAVAKINEIIVPALPRTTYAVTQIHSAERSSLGSVPPFCKLIVNYGSDSLETFNELGIEIGNCVEAGCFDESNRWKVETIQVKKKEIGYTPGGSQSPNLPIVEANYLASVHVYGEPVFRASGNSNSNIPISRGIPAVNVGISNKNHYPHSLDERFCTKDAFKTSQGLFLLVLMVLGIDGQINPLT